MNRPAPARVRASRSGFTLVEILVVIFIIALIITMVGLRGGGARERQALREEAQRLRQLVTLAAEESVLGSRQVGIVFQADGYRFLLLDGQRWREMDDDGFLRARQLPGGITLELHIEGAAEPLIAVADGGATVAPQVMLLSSGEATPFVVELRNRSGGQHRLSVDATATILLEAVEDGS